MQILLPKIKEKLQQGMMQKKKWKNFSDKPQTDPFITCSKEKEKKNFKEYQNNLDENLLKLCKNTNMKTGS